MKISVVTCTFNRDIQMFKGLRTVLTQSGVDPFEVIIVDDGSVDQTKEYVKELQKMGAILGVVVKYIYLDHPEPRISCIPRNVGIKAATGDIIIFTEPEALQMINNFSQLIEKHLQNPEAVILASQVWSMGQRIQEKLTEQELAVPERILSHPYAMLVDGNMQNTKAPDADFAITGEANCNAGVLFLVKKDWLIECGGFDENFQGHGFDDFDILNRLGHLGHPLLKCPEIAVIHQWHKKDYPYNIYDAAKANGTISEANIAQGKYIANLGKEWGNAYE